MSEVKDYYNILNRVDYHIEKAIVPLLLILKHDEYAKTLTDLSSEIHELFRKYDRERIVRKDII